ncbi:hypothetical protein EOM60_02805 [Candidatus Saccharibacteria bacterium]|nr:hypothetical protein [Candidatus Saccharibacteria bacterium]
MSKQEKTTQEKVSPEIVEATPAKTARKWNIGSVFWGLLFVLVGVLLLLGNLGLVSINLSNIWQLWPVLIIGAGLSLLSLRGWLGGLVSFVAAIALLGLVTFALVDNPIYPTSSSSSVQTTVLSDTADGAGKLQVTIDTGATDVTLSSSRERRGVEASQESNRLRLVKKAETKGDTRHVSFSADSTRMFWLGGGVTNNLKVDLTRSLPVALGINTGATNVSGDLSRVRLTSLDVDTGASSVDLRLGALERRQEITLDAGASSITLHIPERVGVRVDSNNGLTSTDLEGLDKISDSRYESAGFANADKQIFIRSDLGVTKFEIKRY